MVQFKLRVCENKFEQNIRTSSDCDTVAIKQDEWFQLLETGQAYSGGLDDWIG